MLHVIRGRNHGAKHPRFSIQFWVDRMSLDFKFAALFLWIMPLLAKRSIKEMVSGSRETAFSLGADFILLIAVFNLERCAEFRSLRRSACRARFSADLCVAMDFFTSSIGRII